MRQIQRLDRDTALELGNALAVQLGADPNQVTAEGFTAEYVGGTSPVVVRWECVQTFTVEEWDAIIDAAIAAVAPPP